MHLPEVKLVGQQARGEAGMLSANQSNAADGRRDAEWVTGEEPL